MLARGQRIGKFVVQGVVGAGGMAVVYRVRHAELASSWALKVLTVPRPDIRDRLLREGRYQSALAHPNIVSVTDVMEIGGTSALLMEFVDGPSLDRWLRQCNPTLEDAEAIFRGICEGIAEAHAANLVHRDLKPANVLLARTATGFVPKVTDFGIAKILTEVGNDVSATKTNVAMGTPSYMAPEQIRSAKTVDARADVFSLGCVFFELICGARSFRGGDVLSVLNAVVAGDRLDPREYVPTLSDRLCRVIDGCLQVDREKRFASVAQILDALGEEVAHHRVTTGLEREWEDWFSDAERSQRDAWLEDDDTETIPPDNIWLNRQVDHARQTQPPASERRSASSQDPETTAPRVSLGNLDDDPDVTQPSVQDLAEVTQPNIRRRSSSTDITIERPRDRGDVGWAVDQGAMLAGAIGALGGALILAIFWVILGPA